MDEALVESRNAGVLPRGRGRFELGRRCEAEHRVDGTVHLESS